MSSAEARAVAALLAWYRAARRPLPWRATRDPYAIWVSETMLQQTQVATVLPYYERWLARFPTLEALAGADEAEVLHAWQGLGYYSRARRLHEGARAVRDRHAGELPSTVEALRALPGIGPYTAGALASIAFGARVPLVDGNVIRVLTRWLGLRGDPTRAQLKRVIWARAAELVPEDAPGDFNQALMELGATTCSPRGARCGECPLAAHCVARRDGLVDTLPELPARRAPTPLHEIALAVEREGRWLVVQQAADARRWARLWCLPWTERGADETDRDAVERLAGAHGLVAQAAALVASRRFTVTRFKITLDVYALAGRDTPRAGALLTPNELDSLALPVAHRAVLSVLLRAESNQTSPKVPARARARARR